MRGSGAPPNSLWGLRPPAVRRPEADAGGAAIPAPRSVPDTAAEGPSSGPPVQSPGGAPAIDVQLRRLEMRLLAEAEGDAVREEALRGHVQLARARFESATVRQFLPILIEREVRRRLTAQ